MKLLNLGCGSIFDPNWINIDRHAYSPDVIEVDIRNGIPYPRNYFDAVYHSHVLEHLSKSEGEELIAECARVLKKGGILRVAVPDLESITKEYVRQLKLAWSGDVTAQKNYEWIYLELYDQVTRTVSGGDMESYLYKKGLTNKSYIRHRLGLTANLYFSGNNGRSVHNRTRNNSHRLGFLRAISEARFRDSGEIHKVMYDKYSLKTLLIHYGFINVMSVTAFKSGIINFNRYNLDTLHGKVRKADSLFMEARKL